MRSELLFRIPRYMNVNIARSQPPSQKIPETPHNFTIDMMGSVLIETFAIRLDSFLPISFQGQQTDEVKIHPAHLTSLD